jgi:hypothetical protein
MGADRECGDEPAGDEGPTLLPQTRKVKRRLSAAIPTQFVPEFWTDQDNRQHVARTIRQMVARLRQDVGADSYQKDLLIQRAVFLSLQLETAEIEAVRSGAFDPGVYTQQINSLLGILKALGLEKKAKKVGVKDYLAGAPT